MIRTYVAVVIAGLLSFGAGCTENSQIQKASPVPTTSVPNVTAPTEPVVGSGNLDKTVTKTVIDISGFAFSPNELTLMVGSTVIWTNLDSAPHTVTANNGTFSSPRLSRGDTFSYTFDKAGSYSYYCAIHPSMRATIIVK